MTTDPKGGHEGQRDRFGPFVASRGRAKVFLTGRLLAPVEAVGQDIVSTRRGLDPNRWFGNVERIPSEKIGREMVTYVGNTYETTSPIVL